MLTEFQEVINNGQPMTSIEIAPGQALCAQIESVRVLELEPRDTFRRHVIFIDQKDGSETVVLTHVADFEPTNRRPILDKGTALPYLVFSQASTLGSITVLENQTHDLVSQAEELAYTHASNMRSACEVSGIQSDRNIQLSGMSAVAISSGTNSDPAIAFLFGKNGLFNKTVVIPESGQERLIQEIETAGGRTLISGRSKTGSKVTFDEFNEIRVQLLKLTQASGFAQNTSDLEAEWIVKAFLANIPLFVGLHQPALGYNEVYRAEKLLEYLDREVNDKFTKLLSETQPVVAL